MAKESTIRVFRSDTTSVPTGLTFGELAFSHVAGNSQLYIGNTASAPVWIGAGVTTGDVNNGSEFLVPTQSAVKAFVEAEVGEIVGGGGGVVNNFNGTGGSVTMTGDGGAIFNVQTDKDNVIGARLASTSVTGVASFSSTNFAVAAGQVTIKDGGVANAELVSPFIVVRNDTGTTGDVQLGNTLTITGNQGLDIALGKSTGAVTITLANTGVLSINGSTGNYGLPLASTSVTGVASFNDSYFSVDGNGKVALVAAYQVTGDRVSAGSFIGVTRSGNSVTVSNTGVHSINGVTGAITNVAKTNADNNFSVVQTFDQGLTVTSNAPAQINQQILATYTTNVVDVLATVDGVGVRVAKGTAGKNSGVGSIALGRSATTANNTLLTNDDGTFTVANGTVSVNTPIVLFSSSQTNFLVDVFAPNIVNSFNGATGDVAFSTYVETVNGVTGAITNVAKTDTAQTFTAIQSFSAGLTAAGATFAGAVVADAYRVTSNAINAQVGTTYSLLDSDNGKIITMDNASPITLTVPSGLPVGFNTTVIQLGAGAVGIISSGTTLNSFEGKLNMAGQHAAVSIISYTSNVFNVAGGLTG